MSTGLIYKALSGFYYINDNGRTVECRAKGRFRFESSSPLVGDIVDYEIDSNGKGIVKAIHPRKNSFIRPAVANVDALVFVASTSEPETDPFLIDRVSVIAKSTGCEFILCINKTDLNPSCNLASVYSKCPFTVCETSAANGEGIEQLRAALKGKRCAFTGNSGVGKSSILNCLVPGACAPTAEISTHLGRGKHTTRHVEFYPAGENTYIADTPGFASFDIVMINDVKTEELQYDFAEFSPYIGRCRFNDCAHINEPDCAIRAAVESGTVSKSRHESYKRLYDIVKNNKPWN